MEPKATAEFQVRMPRLRARRFGYENISFQLPQVYSLQNAPTMPEWTHLFLKALVHRVAVGVSLEPERQVGTQVEDVGHRQALKKV